jgi:hypothetical protein
MYAQTQIPDEGAFTPYGSSYSAANPNVSYTVDGMRVHANDFMNFAGITLQQPLLANEYFFRFYEDRHIKWLDIPDLSFLLQEWNDSWLLPENPTNKGTPMTEAEVKKHKAAVEELLQDETCKSFLEGVLSGMGEGERKAFSRNLLTIW